MTSNLHPYKSRIGSAHPRRHPYEAEIARFWWGLLPGSLLPLSDGRLLRLLFPGRSGGAMGPDVRDAVFCSVTTGDSQTGRAEAGPAARTVGDVEFHIRAADWFVHEHHTDPRYNAVILHVVARGDDTRTTLRQDGQSVPLCNVRDLPLLPLLPLPEVYTWPCHYVIHNLNADERAKLFIRAGLLRFEQKTQAFLEQLHRSEAPALYDLCLVPALAEGLGYGRDRAFFRALGRRLVGLDSSLPEPLGRADMPAPLDAARLRVLKHLVEPGLWERLRCLLSSTQANGARSPLTVLQALQRVFQQMGLSLARADILICNVIYPFAAAVALLERHARLEEWARTLYLQHPGLPSNRVTRLMCEQLLLAKEPQGSCQQQGLHYVYQQSCREKQCGYCLIGKKDI